MKIAKIIYVIEEIDHKIPDSVNSLAGFIVSMLTLAGIIGGFLFPTVKIAVKFFPEIQIISILPWALSVILFAIILLMRHKMIQYRNSLSRRLDNDAGGFYLLNHDFRNYYFDILRLHKERNLNKDILTHKTIIFLRHSLDKLCEIFTTYTGQEMNACIKLIANGNPEQQFDKIDVDNATVHTFVRSSNISKSREDASNDSPVPIKENTDFLYIIDPPSFWRKRSWFYEKSLKDFDERLYKKHGVRYQNTTKNYDLFYKATVVVPIRIAHSRLFFTNGRGNKNYHTIGFLCVDTLSTNAFIDNYEDRFVQFAKAYASVFYVALNKYQYYLGKLPSILEEKSMT